MDDGIVVHNRPSKFNDSELYLKPPRHFKCFMTTPAEMIFVPSENSELYFHHHESTFDLLADQADIAIKPTLQLCLFH